MNEVPSYYSFFIYMTRKSCMYDVRTMYMQCTVYTVHKRNKLINWSRINSIYYCLPNSWPSSRYLIWNIWIIWCSSLNNDGTFCPLLQHKTDNQTYRIDLEMEFFYEMLALELWITVKMDYYYLSLFFIRLREKEIVRFAC